MFRSPSHECNTESSQSNQSDSIPYAALQLGPTHETCIDSDGISTHHARNFYPTYHVQTDSNDNCILTGEHSQFNGHGLLTGNITAHERHNLPEFSREALPTIGGEKIGTSTLLNPGTITPPKASSLPQVSVRPAPPRGRSDNRINPGASGPTLGPAYLPLATPTADLRLSPETLKCIPLLPRNNAEGRIQGKNSGIKPEPAYPSGSLPSPGTVTLRPQAPGKRTTGRVKMTDSGHNSQALTTHCFKSSTQASSDSSDSEKEETSYPSSTLTSDHPDSHNIPPMDLSPTGQMPDHTADPFFPTFDPVAVAQHSDRIASFWPHPTAQAMEECPEFCKTYSIIKSFNLPNVLGVRLTLKSGLNLSNWESQLHQYHEKEVCAFLCYGWPLGYSNPQPPTSVQENHPSGNNHMTHVNSFIHTELTHQAIVGPFKDPPFFPWTRNNPIMTRPKKDTQQRRIIIDLTFPQDEGVNQGIDIHSILGRDISYSLPNIWDLTTCLQTLGAGAWVWKADLQRAYRQLRVDPLDTPFLGMKVQGGTYIDLCPSFGCRSSSAACQHTSNALAYLMRKKGFITYAYLDDYAGCCATEEEATRAYNYFLALANHLGLDLATDKCHPPQQNITWLGYTVDTVKMQVSIPEEKIRDLKNECMIWMHRRKANKKMLQSLIGKVLHAAGCIRHERKFTARLLSTVRSLNKRQWTTLTEDCRADIR